MPVHKSPDQQSGAEKKRDDEEAAKHVGEAAVAGNPEVTERHEKLAEDVDAILDEIDEVLESNAEDFVRAFVQKGGQ